MKKAPQTIPLLGNAPQLLSRHRSYEMFSTGVVTHVHIFHADKSMRESRK